MKNDKYHTCEITIYYEVNKPKKQFKFFLKIYKRGQKQKKKHKNVWITFAFVFQRRKTNVMPDEHKFYVLWLTFSYSINSVSVYHNVLLQIVIIYDYALID